MVKRIKNHIEKFLRISLVLLLICTGLVGGLLYFRKNALIAEEEQLLLSIAQEREDEINNYFYEQEKQAEKLASDPRIIELLEQGNPDIEQIQKTNDYKNILLISNNLEIVFSLTPTDRGIDLSKIPYTYGALSQSVSRAKMSMTTDIAEFSFYEPENRPALFISTPVRRDSKLLGILVVQLDETAIGRMQRDYKNLGKTGEAIFLKRIDDSAIFLTPTRYTTEAALVKTVSFFDPDTTALRLATTGGRGMAVIPDHRHVPSIIVWRYLPFPDWGMNVKIDLAEVLSPLKNLTLLHHLLLILTALVFLAYMIFFVGHNAAIDRERKHLHLHNNIPLQRILLIVAVAVFGCLLTFAWYRYNALHKTAQAILEDEAQRKMEDAYIEIETNLNVIATVGESVAADLTQGRLHKKDIHIRLERDVSENDAVYGMIIAYEPHAWNPSPLTSHAGTNSKADTQKRLYAPIAIGENRAVTFSNLESKEDYTKPAQKGEPSTEWYRQGIAHGASWSEPFYEPINHKLVVAYSVPFFASDKKEHQGTASAIGVVAVLYELAQVKQIVGSLSIGETGYCFITSDKGHFIYHPVKNYVEKQETIFSIADQTKNEALREIGKRALGQKIASHANHTLREVVNTSASWHGELEEPATETTYRNELTGQKSIVFYEKMPLVHWSLFVTYIESDVSVNTKKTHRYQIAIITLIILLLLLFLYFITTFMEKIRREWINSLGSAFIFLMGIFAISMLIRKEATFENVPGTPILDTVVLNRFLQVTEQIAANHYEEPPIPLKTGISINALSFPNSNQIEFSGTVWQIIPKNMDILPSINFPQAVKIDIKKMPGIADDKNQIFNWWVRGTLSQKFDNSRFPFDLKNVQIMMEYGNKLKNIILVPDLNSYAALSPEAKPGITSTFLVPGFELEKTEFTLQQEEKLSSVNLVFQKASNVTYRYSLNFNLSLERNILDAITIYLLPLLVIMFALYTIAWFSVKDGSDPYSPLSAYTALMFAVVFLHRALREKLPSDEIIYLEYFFFVAYITMLVLIISTVFLFSQSKFRDVMRSFFVKTRYLYWPVELGALFILTVIIFFR